MMNFRRQLLLAAVLLASVCSARSAEQLEKGIWTIPFTDDGVCIRIPVNCFGETLYFVVDTGASIPIFDTRFSERLGPETGNARMSTGAAIIAGAPIYSCPDLSVGDLFLTADKALCQSLRAVEMVTGERCDGILGISSLKNYIVTIDFDTGTLVVATTLKDEAKDSAIAVPLLPVKERHVAVDAILNNSHHVKLMIDSSDSAAISLNPADWAGVFADTEKSKFHPATMALVGGKTHPSVFARIGSIKLDRIEQKNLICAFAPNPNTQSALGLAFLRRYKATFDFTKQTLYLAPSKHCAEPDNPDMSGLHLLRKDEGTVVDSVDEGSAAASAGIQPGDKLQVINGEDTGSLKMAAIRQRLKAGNDREVRVQIARGSTRKDISFRLKAPF